MYDLHIKKNLKFDQNISKTITFLKLSKTKKNILNRPSAITLKYVRLTY